MEKIWVQDSIAVANVDVAQQLLDKGKEFNINDYVEDNINSATVKKTTLNLIGYSEQTTTKPAIF